MFELQQLLDKAYYTPEAWKVIYNGRVANREEQRSALHNTSTFNNKFNRWEKQNKYENLRTSHWGKTRKQRALKYKRKSRRNGRS